MINIDKIKWCVIY